MEQISDEAKKRIVEVQVEQNVRLQDSMKKLDGLEEKIAALERAKPLPKKSRYIVSTTNDQVQNKIKSKSFWPFCKYLPIALPIIYIGQSRRYKKRLSSTAGRPSEFRKKNRKFEGRYY